MRKFAVLSIMILSAVSSIQAQTATKTFNINDERGRDVVTFTSKAPLETIVGKTSKIKGFVEVDPRNLTNAKAKFEVDLASLQTGIGLRDEHMREQYLETAKYPVAVFELTKVTTASIRELAEEKVIDMMVDGNFSVHGVTKAITIPVTITYFKESESTKNSLPGDILTISTKFNVLLSDYSITRPQFVILKLDDKQVVDINANASTGTPAPAFTEAEKN